MRITRRQALVGGLGAGGALGGSFLVLGSSPDTDTGGEKRVEPRERRYISEYKPREKPRWVPEDSVSFGDLDGATYEITRYPEADPTSGHYEAAWSLYKRSYEAAEEKGYFDFQNAAQDGYKQHDAIHWLNLDNYLNDENLNPFKPENLVYYTLNREYGSEKEPVKKLVGYMYVVDSLDAEGPQMGGPLTLWHYHPHDFEFCFRNRPTFGFDFNKTSCPSDAKMSNIDPEMIHVWFPTHPEGTFATGMWGPNRPSKVNDNTAVKPPKLTKDEFMTYQKERYKKYFDGQIVDSL